MKFFCPRCQKSITVHDVPRVRCTCGLAIDLAALDTGAGNGVALPSLGLVRNYSGEQLGGYAIGECLGAGGMGTVYRARRDGKDVALKVLFPSLGVDPDLVERFKREASVLAGISHPNVVAFLHTGSADGLHFFVMEYLEGPTLEHRLAHSSMSVDEVSEVVQQIAAALEATHARGIVHRDLKPANVILSPRGVKVLDFGVAQVTTEHTITRSDAVLGTFNYMAPEQRIAGKTIDARADVFSLGVILYRMLTGTLPIGRYAQPSALNRDVSRAYDAIVEKALQPDPERRYQKVGALVRDLDRAKGAARRAAISWAAAAVLLLGGPAVASVLLREDPPPPPPVAPVVTVKKEGPASAPLQQATLPPLPPPKKTVSPSKKPPPRGKKAVFDEK